MPTKISQPPFKSSAPIFFSTEQLLSIYTLRDQIRDFHRSMLTQYSPSDADRLLHKIFQQVGTDYDAPTPDGLDRVLSVLRTDFLIQGKSPSQVNHQIASFRKLLEQHLLPPQPNPEHNT